MVIHRTAVLAAVLALVGCNEPAPSAFDGGAGADDPIAGPGGQVDDPDGEPGPVAACNDTSFEPVEPQDPWEYTTIAGSDAVAFVPPNPRAVVFWFHGGGGDVYNLEGIHNNREVNVWREADIGFAAVNANDQVTRFWDHNDVQAANTEWPAIDALREHLIATTDMTETTPVFGHGFSNGAGFTALFAEFAAAEGWPLHGVMMHAGTPLLRPEFPAMFVDTENDDNGVFESYTVHDFKGGDGDYIDLPERVWTPDDMLLHPAYDAEMSGDVFDELVTMGLIDSQGVRAVPLAGIDAALTAYHLDSEVNGPQRVSPLLRVAWALHRVNSVVACEEQAFMMDLGE